MASKTFEVKSDLPALTQKEIIRIEAIDSGVRSDGDTDFFNRFRPLFGK